MSLREKHQMSSDTESATQTGMEGQSRCSHKFLLLQVWCGLLTVAMVVMARFLISDKMTPTEDEVPTLKPVNVSPTVAGSPILGPSKLIGSSLSYILLTSTRDNHWDQKESCPSGNLALGNNSIHCTKRGLYFIYAHVTFSKQHGETKSVHLIKDAKPYCSFRKLVEGTYPSTTQGSVWVAKIVKLDANDSVSLSITGDIRRDGSETFWGAYQLH